MLRSLSIIACLCAIACGKGAPPEPAVTCPTVEQLIHGRNLTPQGRGAYTIAVQRCVDDRWGQDAVRCIRAAKNVDDEDHCYAMLLSKSQRDGLATALTALDPPTQPAPKGVPGLALVERAGTYGLHSDWLDITLPGKPSLVETTDVYGNADLPTTVATFADGPTSFTVVVRTIPVGVVYDAAHALTTSRDDALKGASATLVSDEPHDVGGIPGRLVVGKGGTPDAPLLLEVRLAYDEGDRAQVAVWAMTRGATLDPRATEMFVSLELGAAK
ncbi:MAG TPA: hypothetical protein VGM90_14960 [Kofleriaceae bacterium]|jgi:hypothetical protein